MIDIAQHIDYDTLTPQEATTILSSIESGCHTYRGINQSIVETHIESMYPEKCVVKESD